MQVRKHLQRLCLALTVALTYVSPSHAGEAVVIQDEIVLKSGSKILGKVTGTRDGVVTIETDFAGTLSIALDKIASLQTANPAALVCSCLCALCSVASIPSTLAADQSYV